MSVRVRPFHILSFCLNVDRRSGVAFGRAGAGDARGPGERPRRLRPPPPRQRRRHEQVPHHRQARAALQQRESTLAAGQLEQVENAV